MNKSPVHFRKDGDLLFAKMRVWFGPNVFDYQEVEVQEAIEGRSLLGVQARLREALAFSLENAILDDNWPDD